jgi:hypothetical protein
VKVLVATPEPSEWNGLPVNTAAVLEAGLIERISPIWEHHGGAMTKHAHLSVEECVGYPMSCPCGRYMGTSLTV